MEIGKIKNHTHVFGAPPNWNPETDGPCDALHVKAELTDNGPVLLSDWYPSPDEIKLLQAGHPIRLGIFSSVHPVVTVFIAEAGT